MEAFTLLKYWKAGVTARLPLTAADFPISSATILDSDADDDDGPFFDLEFAVPKEGNKIQKLEPEIEEIIDDDDDEECDGDNGDSLSPSDSVLFFKSRLVRIDGSEDDTSKSGQFPIPVSLIRSATKFRVFMLGLKRSKSQQNKNNSNRKLFKVTFKIANTDSGEDPTPVDPDSGEEKRNNNKKEVMQKYLKLVNPRNIRVSKGNNLEAAEENTAVGRKDIKGLNLKGIMNKKHLGKSKSVVVYSSVQQNVGSNRRDDSLIQQEDGIQAAILHCKRSFNTSSPESEEREELEAGLMLSRSASDPSHEKKRTTTVASELTRKEKKTNERRFRVLNE